MSRPCKKDKSITDCRDRCKKCHRFPECRELVIIDNESHAYMTGRGPATHFRRFV